MRWRRSWHGLAGGLLKIMGNEGADGKRQKVLGSKFEVAIQAGGGFGEPKRGENSRGVRQMVKALLDKGLGF